MHPFFRRVFVFFVLFLISFIAYSSQIFIIWPWYGREVSVQLLILLVPFNIFVGNLIWNYSLCVLTDPGRVPDTWKPDTHVDGYEVKKLTGAPRFCRICKNYKPPRAHHCRTCNRCVLKMDHHCPWINNCVGHFNYGHFLRFLFFVDVACLYHITMLTKRILYPTEGYWIEPSALELIMILLNYVACIPVLFSVGCFSLYHFYSLIGNTTTIESWEKNKVAVMIKGGKTRQMTFPYNLGLRRNIESILGPNPLLWCCPSRTPGSGLRYEYSNKEGEEWTLPELDTDESPIHNSSVIDKSSPWTYKDNSLNPNLQPSNSHSRRRNGSQASIPGASPLPPYHQDYRLEEQGVYYPGNDEDDESSDEQDPTSRGHLHIRRGSEGYEIRPEEREEMLKRYLTELGEVPGRYVRYIPQPESEGSTSEDIPLGRRRERIRQ